MVDHDLSGGVISSLYPENHDTEKENPYKTTCEEVDNEEVYPKKLPSTILLETSLFDTLPEMTSKDRTPTVSSDLPPTNTEEPLISIVNHFSPQEDGAETTKPKKEDPPLPWIFSPSHEPETVGVQGWSPPANEAPSLLEEELPNEEPTLWEQVTQSDASDYETSSTPEEEYYSDYDDNGREPTSWEWETKSAESEEVSTTSNMEIPWYNGRIPSNPEADPPNYNYNWTTFPESEEESTNSAYEMPPAILEIKRRMEIEAFGLPLSHIVKPAITSKDLPTTETTGL